MMTVYFGLGSLKVSNNFKRGEEEFKGEMRAWIRKQERRGGEEEEEEER